ncbi:hypothetical protein AVEN_253860-1 [Araneus ventricosus]|uniref:Uncharacterized protein n=1 Tax=Araneus ventricosus TaxID=182803 RepID=A0A4Y2N8Z4_ARAVE|nr:hypothetical protein AVEN_253860-1 [Araneus ventricosus]
MRKCKKIPKRSERSPAPHQGLILIQRMKLRLHFYIAPHNLAQTGIYLLYYYIVTNMECRFPAKLVLWLGREFYRGMYGISEGMESSTPDLGDHFGDFVDEMWDLKSTGIFLISLLGAVIRIYPDDSM